MYSIYNIVNNKPMADVLVYIDIEISLGLKNVHKLINMNFIWSKNIEKHFIVNYTDHKFLERCHLQQVNTFKV